MFARRSKACVALTAVSAGDEESCRTGGNGCRIISGPADRGFFARWVRGAISWATGAGIRPPSGRRLISDARACAAHVRTRKPIALNERQCVRRHPGRSMGKHSPLVKRQATTCSHPAPLAGPMSRRDKRRTYTLSTIRRLSQDDQRWGGCGVLWQCMAVGIVVWLRFQQRR